MTPLTRHWCSYWTSGLIGLWLTKCFVCPNPFHSQSLVLQSSTGRALDYHEVINTYVVCYHDLHDYELSDNDWEGITLVAGWLKSFHSATTQMSATCHPTLSSTHAIFCGLQEQIKEILTNLPPTTAHKLVLGLTDAYHKLSTSLMSHHRIHGQHVCKFSVVLFSAQLTMCFA